MLKQTISYKDFNGTARTEDLYFNLTEFELIELQASSPRGIQEDMKDAIASKDVGRILAFIKMLVNKAYGVKSEDGRFFEKSPEIMQRFENSALYSDLLLNLFEDEGSRAEKFITGLMPQDLLARAEARSQGQNLPDGVKPDARQLNEQYAREAAMPQATTEGDFQMAPAIGSAPEVSFQAPIPPHPSYTERAEAVEFKVREEPIEGISTSDQAAFAEWKAQQAKQAE